MRATATRFIFIPFALILVYSFLSAPTRKKTGPGTEYSNNSTPAFKGIEGGSCESEGHPYQPTKNLSKPTLTVVRMSRDVFASHMRQRPAHSHENMLKSVLVVGANRGIGLRLIQTFKARGWNTIGSIRPETLASNDPSLADLKATGSQIVQIDYKDETTIKKAAAELQSRGVILDVLVNCGGIKVRPLEWDAHEAGDLMERFQVMVVGPFLVTKHFLPLIKKDGPGKLIYITSKSGSIGAPDHDGEVIGYRMAKAAANQQVKTLALDFQRANIPVTTLAFEPGFIKTKLTGWRGTVDIEESCAGMVNIIEELTLEKSGSFVNWKGETIPW